MRQHTYQFLLYRRVVEDAAHSRQRHGRQNEIDVEKVVAGHVINSDDFESLEHASADPRVALIELGFEGTGGLEGLFLSAEPCR